VTSLILQTIDQCTDGLGLITGRLEWRFQSEFQGLFSQQSKFLRLVLFEEGMS
jgi:hypothetical protein